MSNDLSSRGRQTARRELVDRVIRGSRATSTAAVLLHTALSDRLGLSAPDSRAHEIIHRLGPMTAGELARHTGLATASVTSLIDRLEARGLVRRARDAADRRRVIVETTGARDAELAPLYAPLLEGSQRLLASYDMEQLETIADFLERSAASAQAYITELARERDRER